MILPWYAKYVAVAALIVTCCTYTGLKVAGHYQDKLAAINAIGVVQKQKVKIIYRKQKEVSAHVTQTFTDAVAASDTYWLLHAGASGVPGAAGVTQGTSPTSPPTESDPRRCSEKDGSADAIQVIQLQRFYNGLREAQR